MAEPSVDPLVPHLVLLSLTVFPLPPLCPLPPVFQLDGVDGLGRTPRFVRSSVRRTGRSAALRCYRIGSDRIGIGSDRIGIGWATALRHGYVWHGCRWWACRSIVLAPLGSIVMIITQSVRYLSGRPIPPQSTPCVYEQHGMATSSACLYRPHMPPLTHWPSPIRLEHSDVDGARAPSPATRTSSTLPWPRARLTPSCLTSSF